MHNKWPDDGGLKEPVRSLESCLSAFHVMLKHYFSNEKKVIDILFVLD